MLRAKKTLAKAGLWPLTGITPDRAAEAMAIIAAKPASRSASAPDGPASTAEGPEPASDAEGPENRAVAAPEGDPVSLREVMINQTFLKLKGQAAKDCRQSLQASGFWPLLDVADGDVSDAMEIVSMFTEPADA
jgi:hypothetical protein